MVQSPFEASDLLLSKYVIHGGDGEGDGSGNGEGGNADNTKDAGNADAGKTPDKQDDKQQTPDLQSQLDEERAARIQLQRERDEAAEKANQQARVSQDAAKQVESERDDYKQKYEKLKGLMETSYLETAIMKQDKFTFHDPADVRTFLNQKAIRLNMDSGEVEGLDLELKRIAKDKPYLLKAAEGQGGSGSGGGFTPPAGSTGNHPRGTQQHQRETDRNKLGAKYKIPGFSPIGNRV